MKSTHPTLRQWGMKHLRAAMCISLVLLLQMVLGAATAGASTVGALRICSDCAAAGDLSRYEYVVLQSDQAGRIAALKAKNPRLKALVYVNASATYAYAQANGADWASLPSGVGYVDATENHPGWFLRDTQGNRIEYADYADMWMMDFGSRDYQEAWLANVVREVKENGWDGVLIDDVNANQRLHLGERTLERYPTAADQQRAMKSFLATVGPGLTSKGILALPNIMVEWPDGPTIWSDWIRYTSGAVQEYWTKWGSAASLHFAGADWDYRQSFLDLTQRAGKIYLAITYAPRNDVRSMTYARASFLLDWNGGGSALLFHPGAVDPWHEAWTIDLRAPARAKVAAGAAWKRQFVGGMVVVNPSTSSQTVSLGGSYVAADGSRQTSVTLAPATAAIFRGTGPGTTAPAPPSASAAPPLVSITSPGSNARVGGAFTVRASASSTGGIGRVVFQLDGRTVCTVTAAPYACPMRASSGRHTISATAYATNGMSSRASIRVRV
jgi:hypothetical protein